MVPDHPDHRMIVVPVSRLRAMRPPPGKSRMLVYSAGYTPAAPTVLQAREETTNLMSVTVCTSGRGWFEIKGRRQTVRAGQIMTLPPRLPYACGADPDDPWTIWWIMVLIEGDPEYSPTWPALAEVPDTFRVVGLISDIIRELETDITDASMLVASGAASYLLDYLAAAPHLPRNTSEPLDLARDYIREHVTAPLTIAEIAALVNMSASHFGALFRQRFGIPVMRYQTELRMTRARDLLDHSELTIGAIAEQVGYADPFYFSRQFSSIHHMTPRDYRKQRKGLSGGR